MFQKRSKEASKAPQFIVLFDIDGTLLTGPPTGPTAGMQAMGLAIEKVAGTVQQGSPKDFAGRTDLQIARSLLLHAGQRDPSRERVGEVVEAYLDFLARAIEKAPYRTLGAPRPAVERLRHEGAHVGLGTGNVRAGGRIKLKSAGIADLFDFDKGGFGEDGETRSQVLASGIQSIDPLGRLPVFIVGDTPHDIAAARELGARSIGVPYRHNSSDILKKAGADAVISGIDPGIWYIIEQLLNGFGR